MNKKTIRIAGWALGLSMAVAGIGAAVNAAQKSPMEAKAEEVVYKTALFGSSYNSKSVGSYTDTWSATNSGFTVDVANGNNNNNGWSYVKFGRKNIASVGTIITSAAIDKAVTKVVVTIDALTTTSINSIKLYTSSNKSTWNEAGSYTKAKNEQSVAIASPAANQYYKVEFDCASGSANGLITVSKVEYYYDAVTKYTVTYDANGGTCATESEEIEEGGHPSLPTPTRNYYTFDGWQVGGEGDTIDDSYEVTGDVTLVAKWTMNQQAYTVTYDANGGECATASEDVLENDHPTLPTPIREHYTFNGWKVNGEGDYVDSNYEVASNITLVAQWTEDEYTTVTYSAGDNGSGSFAHTHQYLGSYELLEFANLTGIAANDGYQFKSYTVDGVEKAPGDTFTLSAAKTITVNFEEKPTEYDFSEISGFSSWNNSYSERIIKYDEGTVTFAGASRQTGTVTDVPVTKGSDVSFVADGYYIKGATFECKQWTTKEQTITLHYSTDSGDSYTSTGITSTNFSISSSSLPSATDAVKISFSSSSNQVGIKSLSVSLEKTWSKVFLDTFTCSGITEKNPDGAITAEASVWTSLSNSDLLTDDLKSELKTLTANAEGTVAQQAMARYDLIIRNSKLGKYADSYTDFLERFENGGANAAGAYNVINHGNVENQTFFAIALTAGGALAAGGFFFLRKKKEN